jgi:type VI protein secretion system component VasF
MNQDEINRDDPLMRRVRDGLDSTSGLSPEEAARLARVRRQAFAARARPARTRLPAYGFAVAASVMLVAALVLLRPDAVEPLPPQLAQLEELELLLALEESDPAADPEFLDWVLEERG